MNKLIGKKAFIKSGIYQGEWGIVKIYDGEFYHIAIADGCDGYPIFYRNEFRVRRGERQHDNQHTDKERP